MICVGKLSATAFFYLWPLLWGLDFQEEQTLACRHNKQPLTSSSAIPGLAHIREQDACGALAARCPQPLVG